MKFPDRVKIYRLKPSVDGSSDKDHLGCNNNVVFRAVVEVASGHVLKVSPCTSQLKENVFPTFLSGKKFRAWKTAYCLSTEDGI